MKNLIFIIFIIAALSGIGAVHNFDLCQRKVRYLSAANDNEGVLRRSLLVPGVTTTSALAVGDQLTFQIFDDVVTTFTLKERTESPLGGETFLATANDSDALTAIIMQNSAGITVNFTDCEHNRVYNIVSTLSGVKVTEINPNAGTCEPCQVVEPKLSDVPTLKFATVTTDQASTLIDVLVAFDRNAVTWVNQNHGGITNFATMAVQKMNTAIGNTGFSTKFRFRLVGAMSVDAVGGTDFNGTLNAATDGTGNWAPIKAMRDAVGADTVSVLIDTGSAYGTTGLGWSLKDVSVASFADSAYNVCSVRAVAQSHAMTHETGHNLGAGHSDSQSVQPGPQLYDYSSGYYFKANYKWYHTIMAYSDRYGNGSGDYTAIPYFSSPDYTYEGVAVGDSTHDNVKTINNTYAKASQWRAQKIPMSYDVYFSPEDGFTFSDSISVTLTSGKEGLPIRYTLDGSTPTISSTLYTAPISINQTTTIRAVTITDGVAGPIFEATYSKSDLGAGIDAQQLVWRTSSDYPWTFQTTNTYDGVDALQSAWMPTGSRCESWLETEVTGPTLMSFAFMREYMYYSEFTITCDGSTVFTFDENGYPNDWQLAEIEIPTGKHTLRFTFSMRGYYYDVFNGVYIDQLRFDALSRPPTISPTSTTVESTAMVFTNSTIITLTPPKDKSGTLYYTTDGTSPMGENGKIYTEPLTLTKSTLVRSVFVEGGMEASVEVNGLYLERHPVKPGEWTTDVEGVKTAAAKDGRLICVMVGRYNGCSITSRFYDNVAYTETFLNWAAANGVYLVRADYSIDADYKTAQEWFFALMSDYGDSGSYYYTRMYFALPSAPMTAIAKGGAGGNYVKIGTVDYKYTVESAIAGFASVLPEETVKAGGAISCTMSGLSLPIRVNNDWLFAHGLVTEGDSAATVSTVMSEKGGNGLPRYQSYILGMEPDISAEEQLKVKFSGFDAEGIPIIEYEPTPNEPTYVTIQKLGRKTLPTNSDSSWSPINDDEANYKFFKVKVEINAH